MKMNYFLVRLLLVSIFIFSGCDERNETPPVVDDLQEENSDTPKECNAGYILVGESCELLVEDVPTQNTEPVAEVCTAQYEPVCGKDSNSNEITYSNRCELDKVNATFFHEGECVVLQNSITYDITDNPVDIANAHNWYRANVFSGNELSWDSGLAQDAQNWADYLAENYFEANLSSGAPHATLFEPEKHEFDLFQGENIYMTSLSAIDSHIVTAIEAFGNEVVDYNYEDNSCDAGKVCGHYTQVVWKETTVVGCAESTSQTDLRYKTITVCRYFSPGNYVGVKPY